MTSYDTSTPNGNGATPEAEVDDTHVRDSPAADLQYAIDDVPPWYLCMFLGFQHYLTMFGATLSIALIVTPAMCVTEDVVKAEILGTIFFVSGMVTVAQATIGNRLPIIQGGTFAFLVPTFAILGQEQWQCPDPTAVNSSLSNTTLMFNTSTAAAPGEDDVTEPWKYRMREVQGAIIVASLLQVVVGSTGIMGLLLRFIGPLSIAPTITLIGLALFKPAADFCAHQWWIAIMTICLITLFSQYLRNVDIPCCCRAEDGKRTAYPVFKLFPVVLSIMLAWGICGILTVSGALPSDPEGWGHQARTDTKTQVLTEAQWFRFPYPFQWGIPTFSTAAILGMLAGVTAGMLESVGDYYACARLSGAPPPPIHAINRGILMEGLGCVLAGMWGTGSGTTSYSENVGAIGITKVGSRRVIQSGGLIMIALGLLGKFGALFVTIPEPIIGGVFMVMFGMITAVGVSNLQYVDLNSSRNLFVFGFSVFFGLSMPQWLDGHKQAIQTGVPVLNQILTVLLSTSMFVGGALAFILDNTVPGTLEERGMVLWHEHLGKEKGGGEDGGAAYTGDKPPPDTYDCPVGMPLLRRLAWTRYFPVCPTFRGFPCGTGTGAGRGGGGSADVENGVVTAADLNTVIGTDGSYKRPAAAGVGAGEDGGSHHKRDTGAATTVL